MWPNPQETADLVTFTEEILNGKLHFLCSDRSCMPVLKFKLMLTYVRSRKIKSINKTSNSIKPFLNSTKTNFINCQYIKALNRLQKTILDFFMFSNHRCSVKICHLNAGWPLNTSSVKYLVLFLHFISIWLNNSSNTKYWYTRKLYTAHKYITLLDNHTSKDLQFL